MATTKLFKNIYCYTLTVFFKGFARQIQGFKNKYCYTLTKFKTKFNK